jgi:hypothetical protein
MAAKVNENARPWLVAHSPDWIRLCYMSQKIMDALVKFEQ